jgi:hypothetical protein
MALIRLIIDDVYEIQISLQCEPGNLDDQPCHNRRFFRQRFE